jgi:hypothetical protein
LAFVDLSSFDGSGAFQMHNGACLGRVRPRCRCRGMPCLGMTYPMGLLVSANRQVAWAWAVRAAARKGRYGKGRAMPSEKDALWTARNATQQNLSGEPSSGDSGGMEGAMWREGRRAEEFAHAIISSEMCSMGLNGKPGEQ